ncbi:uncharacterized protein LOC112198116 isoform X2 [Rosa chinensis]|uniref:uncharacterized protein LOC112198116 isoform X2 n=1 Tax=Rosa chinensis TaxID=74649 RepID=UPI001AD90E10|nr:uncharacterized protein LOC112198116 isoform X2 [Rosa chinensis]
MVSNLEISFSVSDVKDKYKVFIACGTSQGEDPFRKPKPGLWHMLEQHFNSGISIDMKQSFYIGDAAGRSNDHSDAVLSLQSSVVRVLDYLITCQNLIEKCFKWVLIICAAWELLYYSPPLINLRSFYAYSFFFCRPMV